MKFTWNDNGLQKRVGTINKELRNTVEKALGVVGLAILEDTIQQEPKPPFETGYLRGAQFMYVLGNLKQVPGSKQSQKLPDGSVLTNNPPATQTISQGEFKVEVGLNTPYAARMHEELGVSIFPTIATRRGTPKDTQGVSGKFLQSKLERFKDQYAEIFAREVGRRL
jgi:hypothetical protein